MWGVEEPNAPDTLAALESLRLLGVEPPEPERTARFLRRLQYRTAIIRRLVTVSIYTMVPNLLGQQQQ